MNALLPQGPRSGSRFCFRVKTEVGYVHATRSLASPVSASFQRSRAGTSGRSRHVPVSTPGDQIGTIFAGYRIEGVLGEEAWAWSTSPSSPSRPKGRDQGHRPALASDPDYLERFRRESRLAAAIEHPNAIPIYEAGVAGRTCPISSMRSSRERISRRFFAVRAGGMTWRRRYRRPDRGRARRGVRARPRPPRREAGQRHRRVAPRHRTRLPDRLRPDQGSTPPGS